LQLPETTSEECKEFRHFWAITAPSGVQPDAASKHSVNFARGEVDLDALVAGRFVDVVKNPQGKYRLYRVGDAVASRNVHAALWDSLRICSHL
jgi:hypothetical protein